MDIKIVSLVTGEDIIADTKAGDNAFSLKNPVVLSVAQDQQGNAQLGFRPWKPFAKDTDKGIEVFSEHVLAVSEPEDDISNAYNQQFGTGLVVPQQGVQSAEGEGTFKIDDFRNKS